MGKLRLSYQEIDSLVRKYHEASKSDKSKYRDELVQSFHSYFMKYVELLKNHIHVKSSNDTNSFWTLFADNTTGNKTTQIKRYIYSLCSNLEDQEIYNELVCMFLTRLNKFEFRSNTSFLYYITKYMRWDIKDWLISMLKHYNTDYKDTFQYMFQLEEQKENLTNIYNNILLPVMDLDWVGNCSLGIFSKLTIHERFLLYLNFKEELGTRQIGDRLGKKNSRTDVALRIQKILKKLKKIANNN